MVSIGYPRLVINLEKIRHNAQLLVEEASQQGVSITGVTKCCCGNPSVARAMLEGGVSSIADSRIRNIEKLRKAGLDTELDTELMLLRTPMKSQARRVVQQADTSLNSELSVVKSLSQEAGKQGKEHKVILMVEMGDLREGIPSQDLEETVKGVLELEGIKLSGLGMNLACFGGVVPTQKKVEEFSELVKKTEEKVGADFQVVSGGNSANIPLLLESRTHEETRVNNLRIGEGILLGLETVNRTPIPNAYQDAFSLEAELIELKEKPSVPWGEVSQNAFGKKPRFEDRGKMRRGLVAVGRQDVMSEGLRPVDNNISIIGASSDHLIIHADSSEYEVGDKLVFQMNYGALLRLFTSDYVEKKFVRSS